MLETIIKVGTSAAAVVGLGLGIKAAYTDRKQNKSAEEITKNITDNQCRIDSLKFQVHDMKDRVDKMDGDLEVLRNSINDLYTRANASDNDIAALVRYLNQAGMPVTPVAPVPQTNGDDGTKVDQQAEAKPETQAEPKVVETTKVEVNTEVKTAVVTAPAPTAKPKVAETPKAEVKTEANAEPTDTKAAPKQEATPKAEVKPNVNTTPATPAQNQKDKKNAKNVTAKKNANTTADVNIAAAPAAAMAV